MTTTEWIEKLRDPRGNPLGQTVKTAIKSSIQAMLSGTPQDSAHAGMCYRQLKGGEMAIFTKALKEWNSKNESGTVVPKGDREDRKPMPTKTATKKELAAVANAPAPAKAGMSQEVKDKLKAAKAAPKEPKPEIIYNWRPAPEGAQGAKVFTSHGVGIVRGFDPVNSAYKVYCEADEKERAIPEKSVRFKALKEEYRDKYQVDKTVKTPSGAYSVSCGDEVAVAMNGLSVEQLETVATTAGLTERWESWAERNAGMKRMNLSNCLRAMLKKDESRPVAQKAIQMAAKMVKAGPPPKAPKPSAQEAMAAGAPPAKKGKAA